MTIRRAFPFLAGLVVLASACSSFHGLAVRTEYLTPQHLASVQIGTPDPLRGMPYYGQRIIVSWDVPNAYLKKEGVTVILTIRYRNHSEVTKSWPLVKRQGSYVYDLLDKEYETTQGIMTYKVEIIAGDEVLEEWRQKMWVELIEVPM